LIGQPESLNSLNPETGDVYWSEPLKPRYGMTIAAPRKAGDYLFVSGIGKVAALFKLNRERPAVEVAWIATPNMGVFCSASTPTIEGGAIYGNDCEVGNLRAVALDTG